MKSGSLAVCTLVVLLGVILLAQPSASTAGGGRPIPALAPDLSRYPWFYLRDGKPLAADEPAAEIIAVGDIMLGRDVATGGGDPFALTRAWLDPADLAVGNLEAVVVTGNRPSTKPESYRLGAPLSVLPQLSKAGFNVLSLANNHALDYGPQALGETIGRLRSRGIDVIGVASDPAMTIEPHIVQINGLRLAFLAFNAVKEAGSGRPAGSRPASDPAGHSWTPIEWDLAAASAAVASIRPHVDGLLVSLHWGYEYELWADPGQTAAARALLAAGADAVVGHHPHVIQEVRVIDGRLVAYSLGNFVSDQRGEETGQGLALRIFMDKQGLRAVQALPLVAGPQPRLMEPEAAGALLARFQPPAPRTAFACDPAGCRSVEAPQESISGIFWSGETDLTGDGEMERVRRAAERVTVYNKGQVAWTSPPEWRVVDLALGDPNDDGRNEMLLAIWQRDPAGYERSQPYLVGYRGGRYKLLWGGRPVVDPIQEVELGDVTGDGAQELVVVEAGWDDGQRSVAVWRWAGWSFSLVWRSDPGGYHDLALVPGLDRQPAMISVASPP